jgi:Fic family protein
MDPGDFAESAPGRLVPTTHGAHAFVPDPLPRRIPLPPATVKRLAAAERAIGRLSGATLREFNPYLISSPLLHREAILSSRMEGTITTPEQLVLLEAEEADDAQRRSADEDTAEVLNYVRAMQHALRRLENLPISLRLIQEIHRVLLSGVRGNREGPGVFRRSQNFIGTGPNSRIEDARFVPPPINMLDECLGDFEAYLHDETIEDPFLVQLALAHYQFETIHPFRDGNGRVGRLLIPLLMIAKDRLDAPILYLSAHFERNRETYADLLLEVSRKGSWIPWIDFFLDGVTESAHESTRQATALLDLRQQYHRRFQSDRSSARIIRLIDELFQSPSITIRRAASILDITAQGAANNVHKLEEAGIVREITGRTRNQVFVADEILAFLYDQPDTRGEGALARV